ncbi:glycosyl hydrolase family 28-related protein [Nitrospira moscoviensis]|uniref:Rhamnogalacturonase A/B/Epimerase-like pectate lyase domain-containing protein n=1 Tax=Nitrospira moscoviensis TaxID=42253 RepID=A0A0K2GKI6_NITMO|nr:glycosyl hydrolase family 28-related protein [Nitrospira moscoviensis]ALA61142.1 hypothetical protein NITMOv2_4773 [Nitrospira moscoviensis]
MYIVDVRAFSAIGDGVTDDTSAIQSAITNVGGSGGTLLFSPGVYKTTSPLTLPAVGIHIIGANTGGSFGAVLRPYNCAAFSIASVHHCFIENLMIWVQGTTPPATYITLQDCYSIKLKDIRIHLDTTYECTEAAILQTSGNDVVYDHVIVRSDGDYFTVGFKFANGCGTATLVGCDVETCGTGILHLGGQITVLGLYSERLGQYGVSLEPSGDSTAAFRMFGGQLIADNSAVAIAVKDGCKNSYIIGTYATRANNSFQGWIYGLSGSSNIKIDTANFDWSKWGSSVSIDPSVLRLQPLRGSITWNPGSLADGAGETSSAITVTGATFLHGVEVRPPYDLQGITCTGYVSAADTVKIRLQNETGGTIDLASGTWNVVVRRD